MFLNTIYTTFQGEVNPFGIGYPVIFLRLQGCHLRCYKKTLGVLCDTPEGLDKPIAETKISYIFAEIEKVSEKYGIKVVTLTGGDPLWNKEEELIELFSGLVDRGFSICVETSGTISWLPYSVISNSIYWVLDYKLKSSGVKNSSKLFSDSEHLQDLSEKDFIKFVIYDDDDLDEAISVVNNLKDKTLVNFAFGSFWGGKLTTFDIFNRVIDEGLLSCVSINMQTHKMAVSSNYNVEIPKEI